MKLYTIEKDNKKLVAVQGVSDKRLYPVSLAGLNYGDMNELIEKASDKELDTLREFASVKKNHGLGFRVDEVKICAPIETPRQDVLCLGVNYDEHIKETVDVADFQNKEATVYFSKRASFVSGCGDKIPDYDFVDSLDYEVELGVILGKTVKNYKVSDGNSCIFGYTVINDVSARNLQFKHKQWYMGKSLDGYTIMGPCIVTADEISDVQKLNITCKINGELRQNSNTEFMIQPVLNAIEELSQGITLKAATVIATGTPGGVGLGMKPPKYLKSGDVVTCEIENIGVLENTVE
ncbi:MAG: fumarylacetoacetate hydrolase family protein [Butyrivibrio sp.]|nr:fumarylacetoacetate hydrolase family protein [Butyrivibrio sp.]